MSVYNDQSDVTFDSCLFADNEILGNSIHNNGSNVVFGYGSAIFLNEGVVNITNSEIANNKYTNNGYQFSLHGALYTRENSATFNIEGSTIAYNVDSGIYHGSGDIDLTNTIVWGNGSNNIGGIDYSYCNVQGMGTNDQGNIGINPWFVDPENQDYSLLPGSVCINRGTPEDTDPDGTRRDMGCYIYEDTYQGDDWYVSASGDVLAGSGSSGNPLSSIQAAINLADEGDNVIVEEGIYTGEGNHDIYFLANDKDLTKSFDASPKFLLKYRS